MSTALAFVDTETTGLDPEQHEIWEVGLILRNQGEEERWQGHWFLPVDLGRADAKALEIGRFHERYPRMEKYLTPLAEFADHFARLTRGAHLVGAVVSFDAERLYKLLRANGACPEWHYHLVDVEALMAGLLGQSPPYSPREMGERLGVEPPTPSERHTALGDARWAERTYDAVMDRRR